MAERAERVEHVTDTALMVAAARGIESARADALIRDPFATQLAGERGQALVHGVPGLGWMTFVVGMRCRFVDELLLRAISRHKIATVVVLGSGLDTRPWRLDLPRALRWIETDFSAILDYKAGRLAAQAARCELQRLEADLNQSSSRESLFHVAGEGSGLMISEGLLMYLLPDTVEALADDAHKQSGIRHWILDVVSDDLMHRAHSACGSQDSQGIENLRPQNYLRGAQILDLVRSHGWSLIEQRTYTRDAWDVAPARVRGLPGAISLADERDWPSGADPSGVYWFSR
jgi:methyltransferase (TIGR00027 family)